MGWKSTVSITKEDCMKEITMRLYSASNEELEQVLESLWGDKAGYNFRIIDEYPDELPEYHWYYKDRF